MAGHEAVHGDGVEFAQREIGRVGQVDDDNVEFFRRPFQPFGGIIVDDVHFGMGQRTLVERAQGGGGFKSSGHVGVEIDQSNIFDLRIFQDFACRQSVAAAENQNAFGIGNHLHGRQNECFMVTGFVA